MIAPAFYFFAPGDSQTQTGPTYGVRPSRMWVARLSHKLRELGVSIEGRSVGIGGQTSADLMQRIDAAYIWETPAIGVLYIGVNDPMRQTVPSLTPAQTGGSIAVNGSAPFVGIGMVLNLTNGQRLAQPLASVQFSGATSTGSIAVGSVALDSTVGSVDFYVTPGGYSSAALATAASRAMLLSIAGNTGGSATITVLPSGTVPMPTVSTQANIQMLVKSLKYKAVGLGAGLASANWVAGQANLPAGAPPGARVVVMDDTSATGGMAALPNSPAQHATIAGDYSSALGARQSVWERRSPQAGEAGWGRVAIAGTPAFSGCCSRIVVVSTNYLNFAAGQGGDNMDAASSFAFVNNASTADTVAGTCYAPYQAVRVQQAAAAAAEGVPYADLFGFQSQAIKSGETTQGSNAWHAIANNQHHNEYGHDLLARLLANICVSQGWVRALS